MDGWFPRLNSFGRVASGSGSLWVDGAHVFSPGWAPQWLDDQTLVFKGPEDKPHSLYVPTRVVAKLSEVPSSTIVGGGGVWYATSPGEIGADVDRATGVIATCVEHGGSNFDRSLLHGSTTVVAHQPVQYPRAADRLLCWVRWTGRTPSDREPWGWDGTAIRPLRVFEQGWESSPVPFQTPEGPWVLTATNTDLRLRPWGEKLGYLIATGEDQNLNPDAYFIGGRIVVVYNDSHGTLQRWEGPLTAPRVDVSTPPAVDYTVPPVNRALWVGCFTGGPNPGGGWTTPTDPHSVLGNCFLAVQQEGVLFSKGDVRLGQFVTGATVEEVEQAAQAVANPLAYFDARRWPRPPVLPVNSWQCVQAYCKKAESYAAFEAEIREVISEIPHQQPVALVAQCYTSNPTLVEDLRALVPIYARLARDLFQITAVLIFSGSGRPAGLQDHPEVLPSWTSFLSTVSTPEPTMDMEIPREVYDVWKAVADKYFALHNGTEDERREATRRGVSTIRARVRGVGPLDGLRWVCKTEHPTGWSAQSKDGIAYVAPAHGAVEHGRLSQMFMFDMINGSTRRTNPFPVVANNFSENPPNPDAFILIPETKDWLEGDTPPPPDDDTHLYMGGGNDTGICDTCGKSRFDPIHAIPQSKVPHVYDGGEHDTGLCDICQRGVNDLIHTGEEPPPPPADLEARVEALEREVLRLGADLNTLAARVETLENQPPVAVDPRVDQILAALRQTGRQTQSASSGWFGGSHRHGLDPLL